MSAACAPAAVPNIIIASKNLRIRELHRAGNETTWWRTKGVDAMGAARKLWIETHPVRTKAGAI